MNARIRLQDLETNPYKELIRQLAYQWVWAERPAAGLAFKDYINSLQVLLLTTQSPQRTVTIAKTVFKQAVNLDKTSAWVEQELKFEGMLNGVDRADFLLLELQQATGVDDQLLDTYNERPNRFTADEQ